MALKLRKKVEKIQMPNAGTPEEVLEMAREKGIETRPLDVQTLAKILSIRIEYKVLEDDVSGLLSNKDGGWVIKVNSLHHKNRQRFTIAHELAHYFLHKDVQDEFVDKAFFRSDEGVGGIEAEANKFAARLLMPKDCFVKYVKEVSSSVSEVSEYFGVSSSAVKIRADSIRRGEG